MTNPTTEEMERTVWEFFTGKCAHVQDHIGFPCIKCHCEGCQHKFYREVSEGLLQHWEKNNEKYGDNVDVEKYRQEGMQQCAIHVTNCQKNNPPLATSIDAWRPIWEAMSASQILAHDDALRILAKGEGFTWLRTAMHHLQATYDMIKGGK